MKKYGDEEFIYIMNEKLEEERQKEIENHSNNINDGYILMEEEKLTVSRRSVLKGRVSMVLPDSFTLMTKEMAELKYPAKNRPELIYTNAAGTVNLSLSHKADPLKNTEAEAVKNIIQATVLKVHKTKAIESNSFTVSDTVIAYFDFISTGLDTDIYNLMFFFSCFDTLAIGSLNCLKEDMEEWKEVFIQMLKSMEFEPKERRQLR